MRASVATSGLPHPHLPAPDEPTPDVVDESTDDDDTGSEPEHDPAGETPPDQDEVPAPPTPRKRAARGAKSEGADQ